MPDRVLLRTADHKKRGHGIPLEEAYEIALAAIRVTGQETLPLLECAGRVLASDIFARISSPPFRRSAMDGYAVCSRDLQWAGPDHPVILPVIGCNDAGTPRVLQMQEGQTVRIMTGGVLPEGADAVVKQEEVELPEWDDADAPDISKVLFRKPASPGQCYSPVGEDLGQGELLAFAGDPVDASAMAAAAAAGLTELLVRKKVQVAVICTGDELLAPGTPLSLGKIYGSNHLYLQTRLQQLGCEIVGRQNAYAPFAGDALEEIAEKIKEEIRAGAKLILTTGGVSVGRKDYLPEVIRLLEGKILFQGIDLKPGMPSMLSLVDGVPVLSLSGNPYASACIFELIGRRMVRAMAGNRRIEDRTGIYPAAQDYEKASPVRRILRGYFDGEKVYFSNRQRNSQMTAGIGCNCLIDIPAGGSAMQGENVRVILLDP